MSDIGEWWNEWERKRLAKRDTEIWRQRLITRHEEFVSQYEKEYHCEYIESYDQGNNKRVTTLEGGNSPVYGRNGEISHYE